MHKSLFWLLLLLLTFVFAYAGNSTEEKQHLKGDDATPTQDHQQNHSTGWLDMAKQYGNAGMANALHWKDTAQEAIRKDGVYTAASKKLTGAYNYVKPQATKVYDSLKPHALNAYETAKPYALNAYEKVKPYGFNAYEKIKPQAHYVYENAQSLTNAAYGHAKNAVSAAGKKAHEFGLQLDERTKNKEHVSENHPNQVENEDDELETSQKQDLKQT